MSVTADRKPKRPHIRKFREDEMPCFRVLTWNTSFCVWMILTLRRKFPVPVDGKEVKELPLETETTVEVVTCLERWNLYGNTKRRKKNFKD